MRILFITDYAPSEETNGISIHFTNLIEALQEHGHEAVVYSTRGVTHRTGLHIKNIYNATNRITVCPSFVLLKALVTESWDVVHLVFPCLISLPILTICKKRRLPVYCSHHCDLDTYNKKYNYPCVREIFYCGYTWCARMPAFICGDVNAAPSMVSARREFSDCLFAGMTKSGWSRGSKVIPTAVDGNVFCPIDEETQAEDKERLATLCGVPSSKTIILMVNRLAPEKQVDIAINAWSMQSDWHLCIIGSGPTENMLKKMVCDLHCESSVTFLGEIENVKLPPYYRGSDAFLTCSDNETCGITILEALAVGLPIVFPIYDVFEELYGRMLDTSYEINNPLSLIDAITRALQQSTSKTIARQNRKLVKEAYFSWELAASEQVSQYNTLIQKAQVMKSANEARDGKAKGKRIRWRMRRAFDRWTTKKKESRVSIPSIPISASGA